MLYGKTRRNASNQTIRRALLRAQYPQVLHLSSMLQFHAFSTSLGDLFAAQARFEPDSGYAARFGFLADDSLYRSTHRCCRQYPGTQTVTNHRHTAGNWVPAVLRIGA